MQSHTSSSSCSCFCLLDRTIQICVSCLEQLKLVLWVQFSHTDHWMFNMAPHGKELSEDLRIRIVALHKDGRGYKKFSNSLELSYSTVARVIQMFPRGFHSEQASQGSIIVIKYIYLYISIYIYKSLITHFSQSLSNFPFHSETSHYQNYICMDLQNKKKCIL